MKLRSMLWGCACFDIDASTFAVTPMLKNTVYLYKGLTYRYGVAMAIIEIFEDGREFLILQSNHELSNINGGR